MDVLAHALWAGAGMLWLGRRRTVTRREVGFAVTLAALPDLVHLLPIVAWVLFGDGPAAALRTYVLAMPGGEPPLPASVALLSHHLHCMLHSALVAGAVTLLAWRLARGALLPLLGWWSHIVIDVFTHSAEFYPAPVLYPITQRGFDGVAWNSPAFLALNYAALAAAGLWLFATRRSDRA